MNRRQLLITAQSIIEKYKYDAERQCDRTIEFLREHSEWNECEKSLRQAQVEYASNKTSELKRKIDSLKISRLQLLKKYGMTEESLRPNYHCRFCEDTGYVNNAICGCLQNEICKLLSSESNVTDASRTFENSTETNPHNEAVYKKAREITLNGDKNMLVVGNTGSGKTYLVTACANLGISLGKSALFLTAYSLNSMLLEAHLSDARTCQSVLDTLTDVELLVIDDLGTEIVYKNVTAEYLFAVLNERIARRKQTFVSTNLSLQDIRDRYDERIFSRLVDQNTTFVAKLEGKDKRFNKK